MSVPGRSVRRTAETQRQPVPRTDSGELDTALAFLRFARGCVRKKLDGLDDDTYFSMTVPPDRTRDDVLRAYREVCVRTDAIVEAASGAGQPSARPVDDVPKSLRWVLTHVCTETTRHAGHADILRELLDGTTGR